MKCIIIKYSVMTEHKYVTPDMEIIYLDVEGVFCGSNEILYENEGDW